MHKIGMSDSRCTHLRLPLRAPHSLVGFLLSQSDVLNARLSQPNQIKTEISTNSQNFSDATIVATPPNPAQDGRLVLTKHYRRERSPKLRKQKLQQQRDTEGFNYCEACKENASYCCEPEKILEVHHSVPLHHAETQVETKLEDLMILCANCHRAIHAIGSPKDVSELFS